MKYLISIYGNEEFWASLPEAELSELIAATDAHNKAMVDSGELLFAAGLGDRDTITRVHRGDDGATVITDGPYLETKEYLGSFYIVDCDSNERAQELAAGMPSAKLTKIEVWPIMHGGSIEDL